MGKQKIYETPQLTVCGSVEEVTRAIFWHGTGDVMSSASINAAENENVVVPDGTVLNGCNDTGWSQDLCSGS